MHVNLGCGTDYREGWLNVDIDPDICPDRVHDLEDTPWDFLCDSTADVVLMDNVLEHIDPRRRPDVVSEVHRVLTGDGVFVYRLPVPETGVGWDVTHYGVPSWRWPLHPRHRQEWQVNSIEGRRVNLGRLFPERVARWLTRQQLFRGVDMVSVEVVPR